MPKLSLVIGEGQEYSRNQHPLNCGLLVELERVKSRIMEINILSKDTPEPVTIKAGELKNVETGESFLTFQNLRPGGYTVKITGMIRLDENRQPEQYTAIHNTLLLFGEKRLTIPWDDLSSESGPIEPIEPGPQPIPGPGGDEGQEVQGKEIDRPSVKLQ